MKYRKHRAMRSRGAAGRCASSIPGGQEWRTVQEFCIYADFLTVSAALLGSRETQSNYIAPLCPGEEGKLDMEGDIRFLSAPFDNDKWAKFVDYPIQHARMSYEFTALHEENSEAGLVLGSVDHDHWKTGFLAETEEGSGITGIRAFAARRRRIPGISMGIAHGYVHGMNIKSARIFVGYFDSIQEGLKTYGACNAAIRPALPWKGPAPFGWNSFAALMPLISFEKYKEASDFMKSIQDTFHDADGTQYIDYDAAGNVLPQNRKPWNMRGNKPEGRRLLLPFSLFWSPGLTKRCRDTGGNYLYRDLMLRDEHGGGASAGGRTLLTGCNPSRRAGIYGICDPES